MLKNRFLNNLNFMTNYYNILFGKKYGNISLERQFPTEKVIINMDNIKQKGSVQKIALDSILSIASYYNEFNDEHKVKKIKL